MQKRWLCRWRRKRALRYLYKVLLATRGWHVFNTLPYAEKIGVYTDVYSIILVCVLWDLFVSCCLIMFLVWVQMNYWNWYSVRDHLLLHIPQILCWSSKRKGICFFREWWYFVSSISFLFESYRNNFFVVYSFCKHIYQSISVFLTNESYHGPKTSKPQFHFWICKPNTFKSPLRQT